MDKIPNKTETRIICARLCPKCSTTPTVNISIFASKKNYNIKKNYDNEKNHDNEKNEFTSFSPVCFGFGPCVLR